MRKFGNIIWRKIIRDNKTLWRIKEKLDWKGSESHKTGFLVQNFLFRELKQTDIEGELHVKGEDCQLIWHTPNYPQLTWFSIKKNSSR